VEQLRPVLVPVLVLVLRRGPEQQRSPFLLLERPEQQRSPFSPLGRPAAQQEPLVEALDLQRVVDPERAVAQVLDPR